MNADVGALELSPLQQALAITGALLLMAYVLRLVYVRRLREDYAAVWFGIAVVALMLAAWQDALRLLARVIEAKTLTNTVFAIAIVLLTLVALHFSVRISELARRTTRLSQELSLLGLDQDETPRDNGADS